MTASAGPRRVLGRPFPARMAGRRDPRVRRLVLAMFAASAAVPLLVLPGIHVPSARALPSVPVSGIRATAPLTALLLSRDVSWTTDPDALVEFQLLDGEAVLAAASARARADGSVTATFPADGDSVVRPGRVVSARNLQGGPSVSETVPSLLVVLDESRNRVVGTGPPSTTLTVRVVTRDLVNMSAAATDGAGNFVIELPAHVSGDDPVRGTVTVEAGNGLFTSAFEELTAGLDIGGSVIHGRGTRGSRVSATVYKGDRRATSNEFVIEGGAAFTLTVSMEGALQSIAPGDRVIVREDGFQRISIVTPPLAVGAAPSGVFSGTAAPVSIVDVSVVGPEGNGLATVESDLDGRFSVDLSDRVLSLPGSWATVTTHGRLVFRTATLVKGVIARLYATWVTGVAEPGAPVLLTVLDADQVLMATSAATVGSDGTFRAQLLDRRDRPALLEPGGILLVSIGGRLTHRAELSSMAAFGSPADDAVVGTAPAGRRVAVTAGSAMRRTVVDDIGILVTDFAVGSGPRANIVSGQIGSLTLDDQGPDVVVRAAWVAPLVELGLGMAHAQGVGSPGRPVTLMLSAGGFAAAEASVMADETTGSFSSTLQNSAGATIPVLSGDQATLQLPGWDLSASVPELSATGSYVTDRVSGRGPPGEAVFVSVPGADRVPAAIDAAGRYSADMSSRADLDPGDSLRTEILLADAVTVSLAGDFPRLGVELDTGILTGVSGPMAPLASTLYRAGLSIAEASTRTDASGAYTLALASRAGEGVAPLIGDRLVVQDGARTLDIDIPELTLGVVPDASSLSGRAPPGSPLSVTFAAPWDLLTGRPGVAAVTADPSGAFTAAPPGGVQLMAGSIGAVRLTAQPGVTFERRASVPYLDMQRGGNLVRGVASPGGLFRVEARRGGTLMADARGRADRSGVFSVTLQTRDGGFRLQPGDDVGLQDSVSAAVQSVALGLTAPDRRASGLAAAGADVGLVVENAGRRWGPLHVEADARGAFAGTLPGTGPLAPGTMVEAGVISDAGHRTFALDAVALVLVRIGSAELRGRDAPFADINARLGAVVPIATGRARALTDGAWSCVLEGADGPVAARSGEQLRVIGAGGREISFEIPELAVSVDEWGQVRGRAAPRELVGVELYGPGPVFEITVRAGADGAWSVGPVSFGGEPPFPFTDTTAALAWITTAAGHRVEAHAIRVGAVPTQTSLPPGTGTAPATPPGTATATNSPSPWPVTATPTTTVSPDPTAAATVTPTATRHGRGPLYLPIVRSRK